MAPRANWKGYLKLSLVSCPVALFPAASATDKVSFHMLSRATGNRLKQQYVDAETGDLVERPDRVRGYQLGAGTYAQIEDKDLDAIQIESSHTIDIERFVARDEVDPVYIDNHYYIAPDDKVGAEAFAVIREAMERRGMVGVARVVLFGRERVLMLEPRGAGLLGTTLHFDYEVRDDHAYFDDIPKVSLTKELLDLASHIIDTKAGTFAPSAFKDRYQEAVLGLIKAKQQGRAPPAQRAQKPGNVVNLMDALRRSLAGADTGGRPPRRAAEPAKAGAHARKRAAGRPRAKRAG
jgi:DNA end-binding protein Ku